MAGGGASPFYSLQDLHAAQDAPGGLPVSDPGVEYDTAAAPPGPDVDAQYAAAANAWQAASAQPPPGLPNQTAFGAAAPLPGAEGPPDAMAPFAAAPAPAPPMAPPSLEDRLQGYIQQYTQQYARFKEPLRVPSRVGLLANILTMGSQAAANEALAQRQNFRIQHDNMALDMKALDAARQAYAADATREMAEKRYQLSLSHLDLDALRFQSEIDHRNLSDELSKLRNERERLKFAFSFPGVEGPQAPTETAAPSAGVSTSDQPPAGGAGGYAPPAPGSPLAGGGAAPGAAPAAPSTARRPGESLYDYGQRRKAESAAATAAARERVTTTASTRTMSEAAPKVLDFVDRIEKNLKTVAAGPLVSRYHEFKTGTLGMADPAWSEYRTNVNLLQTLLMRMHVGARGSQGIMDHFRDLLDQGRQSPENMRAALSAIREYAQGLVNTEGEGTWHPPTTTPTGASPSPSSPPSTTTTTLPAGAADVESILRKHGY